MTEVTQAEFARMKGVARKTVTVWKDQGYIKMNGNLVDVEASQTRLIEGAGKRARGRAAVTQAVTQSVTQAGGVTPTLERNLSDMNREGFPDAG